MRCYICDRLLTDHEKWEEPCTTCKNVIRETADELSADDVDTIPYDDADYPFHYAQVFDMEKGDE